MNKFTVNTELRDKAHPERIVRVPYNERPDVKMKRLADAQVRVFIVAFPDDALKIFRELMPEMVK